MDMIMSITFSFNESREPPLDSLTYYFEFSASLISFVNAADPEAFNRVFIKVSLILLGGSS